jgi:hypothetical protein
MVTLSGTHIIGHAQCTLFNDRLYNFSGVNLDLDHVFLTQLQHVFPANVDGGVNSNLMVPMEPRHALLLGRPPQSWHLRLRPDTAGQRAHHRAGLAERLSAYGGRVCFPLTGTSRQGES